MAAIGASARVTCEPGSSRRYSIAGGASRHSAAIHAPAIRSRLAVRVAAASGAGELSFGWPASEASFYAADVADTAAAAAPEEGSDPAEGPFDVVGLGQASSNKKNAIQPINQSLTDNSRNHNCRP